MSRRYKTNHLQPPNHNFSSSSNSHQSNQQYHTRFPTLSTKTHQSSKMAFIKSLLIASVAAFAYAAPQAEGGAKEVNVHSQENAAKCGNGQKIACCNSGEDLIGANCLSIPIRKSPKLPRAACQLLNSGVLTDMSSSQSPSPSRSLAAPTSLPAARLATPRATSSTSRPTALPFLFKRLAFDHHHLILRMTD